jgi:hypothetical protein
LLKRIIRSKLNTAPMCGQFGNSPASGISRSCLFNSGWDNGTSFMSPSAQRQQYSYDIFISHNRADKEWARALAERLAAERLHGRALRPWLDEQFLDPGGLASDAELTTAIDRSRLFGLVLSPEAVDA